MYHFTTNFCGKHCSRFFGYLRQNAVHIQKRKAVRNKSILALLSANYEIENVSRVCIAWYKHERGWENSGRTVENSPNPSNVYIRLCKHRKKVFYCFYKIFLKINSPINFLIQKDFPNTRSRQSSFPLTNQNLHLIMHEPIKFRVTKVKLKFKFVEIAREQASAV